MTFMKSRDYTLTDETAVDAARVSGTPRRVATILLTAGVLLVAGVLVWEGKSAAGNPQPDAPDLSSAARVLDIGVLVFREGLECILVLAAVTAGVINGRQSHGRAIAAGAGVAFIATLITWQLAVGVIDNLSEKLPALNIQVVTGLLAIIVLVIVMNWFFHKVYWTGWISFHNKRKRALLESDHGHDASQSTIFWGMGLLGFTSLYREGFEVVLFLQSYRLKLGGTPVLYGVLLGGSLTAIVAVVTFIAHRRLPYKRMLVFTGVMLGVVLLVMVGEQAQEMQLAHWLPITSIPWLVHTIPPWMSLWFSIFPTVETLAAQAIAASLVLGSYVIANR